MFNSVYPAEYLLALVVITPFIIVAFIGYSVLLSMPGSEKNNRSIKISMTLNNAVAYIYAMRRRGSPADDDLPATI
ncbi:MAG: hypothetical protein WCF90_04895 [Methanomicrobiales archaeon]